MSWKRSTDMRDYWNLPPRRLSPPPTPPPTPHQGQRQRSSYIPVPSLKKKESTASAMSDHLYYAHTVRPLYSFHHSHSPSPEFPTPPDTPDDPLVKTTFRSSRFRPPSRPSPVGSRPGSAWSANQIQPVDPRKVRFVTPRPRPIRVQGTRLGQDFAASHANGATTREVTVEPAVQGVRALRASLSRSAGTQINEEDLDTEIQTFRLNLFHEDDGDGNRAVPVLGNAKKGKAVYVNESDGSWNFHDELQKALEAVRRGDLTELDRPCPTCAMGVYGSRAEFRHCRDRSVQTHEASFYLRTFPDGRGCCRWMDEMLESPVSEARPWLARTCLGVVLSGLALCVFAVAWSVVGGLALLSLEGVGWEERRRAFLDAQSGLVYDLATELRQVTPHEDVWKEKIQEYVGKHEELVVFHRPSEGTMRFGLGGAWLQALSIMSTSGLGSWPKSHWSKVFLIPFALVGIPVYFLIVVNLGSSLGYSMAKLYRRIYGAWSIYKEGQGEVQSVKSNGILPSDKVFHVRLEEDRGDQSHRSKDEDHHVEKRSGDGFPTPQVPLLLILFVLFTYYLLGVGAFTVWMEIEDAFFFPFLLLSTNVSSYLHRAFWQECFSCAYTLLGLVLLYACFLLLRSRLFSFIRRASKPVRALVLAKWQ
ncbi:unnamed protein product [Darwinula stevensoni]|uniref:Uncharacterized protein n=1 Tax=Darwinula stevensoni TaxID=69355 RepID=A0A7R8XDF9_9CRUS|nr:unnamed protein product [Darwinula stevensoni]CAG0894703.1 unnamed protein product [Darwinula stevensoni]